MKHIEIVEGQPCPSNEATLFGSCGGLAKSSCFEVYGDITYWHPANQSWNRIEGKWTRDRKEEKCQRDIGNRNFAVNGTSEP